MKKLYIAIGITFAATATTLAILSFGNVGWSKHVWIWQFYTYPNVSEQNDTDINTYTNPPTGYTGMWKTWHRNGQMWTQCDYIDGKPHGFLEKYDHRGSLIMKDRYESGEMVETVFERSPEIELDLTGESK